MSLDIYLSKEFAACPCCGRNAESEILFTANITHNLGEMAKEAGLYGPVWRPEEKGYAQAHQIIPALEVGLALLESDPLRFGALNPENGWGSYEKFVPWVQEYLEACRAHPDATIQAFG